MIPLSKLGMVDVDLASVPRKAWIIVAWAVFLLSVGASISLARRGSIVVITHGWQKFMSVEQAEQSYVDKLIKLDAAEDTSIKETVK